MDNKAQYKIKCKIKQIAMYMQSLEDNEKMLIENPEIEGLKQSSKLHKEMIDYAIENLVYMIEKESRNKDNLSIESDHSEHVMNALDENLSMLNSILDKANKIEWKMKIIDDNAK